MKRTVIIAIAVLTLLAPAALAADLDLNGSVRVRGEYWDWFETSAADGEYVFFGSTLKANAGQKRDAFDWKFEVEVPILIGLPNDAIAPAPQGQLGLGATYFALNRDTEVASIFVKQAWINIKGLGEGNNLKLGRFGFTDGMERSYDDANLMWLKRMRVAQRLIGGFGFTHVGRSFDGAHFSHNREDHNFTLLAAIPTQGVFDVDGGSQVDDVVFGYASYTRGMDFAPGEFRVFAIQYEDGRGTTKTDNSARRFLDREDLSISTLGFHWAQIFPTGNGVIDLLTWGSWQTGDWGVQDHSASAYALEAGYRFENVPGAPWIRAGYFNGSGDSNPNDNDHDTFFQVLPTPRVYARFPAYNLMNNEDTFLQLFVQPAKGWGLRADYHRISLNESNDLWYAGGGAFNNKAFGFVARPSFGKSDLMDVLDLSVGYKINKNLSTTFYISHASGDDLIDVIYPEGSGADYIYLEMVAKF